MRRLALTRLARADLVEIASYSRRVWGAARGSQYVGVMMERMQRLRVRPFASSLRAELAPGLRSARARRHLIFFFTDDDLVSVVRVVHERANASARIVRAIKAGRIF